MADPLAVRVSGTRAAGTSCEIAPLRLRVQKPAQNSLLAKHKTGVCGKHHVGRSRKGRDDLDGPVSGENTPESIPLLGGQGAIRTVNVAFHPRIDHVIDLKMRRRAHQITRN